MEKIKNKFLVSLASQKSEISDDYQSQEGALK